MKNDDNRLRRRQLDFQTKMWGKWICLEGEKVLEMKSLRGRILFFGFARYQLKTMSTLFLLRERFGEKDDNWKSTTTDFCMNLGWKKMSKEIQWQLNFCCEQPTTNFDFEKDDNWKSTTTYFCLILAIKKMSKEIQWQLDFVRNDNNQQRKNFSTWWEEKFNC